MKLLSGIADLVKLFHWDPSEEFEKLSEELRKDFDEEFEATVHLVEALERFPEG